MGGGGTTELELMDALLNGKDMEPELETAEDVMVEMVVGVVGVVLVEETMVEVVDVELTVPDEDETAR